MKRWKPDHEQLGVLCRALGQMYHAGVGAGDALALLAEDEPSSAEKELLERMSLLADDGLPLAEVFRKADCFPTYLCSLLQVGETVGRGEDTLFALADYYDGRTRLERQLKNTLLYPAVLLLVLLAVIFVLLVWVLPVFNDVYARLGSRLTGVAGGLLALGQLLRRGIPLLGGAAAVTVCFAVTVSAVPGLRKKLAGLRSRVFGDRGIGRRVNTARFLQALAMGLSGGLTDWEAAELALGLAEGNGAFQSRCRACLEALREGESLAAALRGAEMLSKAQSRLLETGTRAGSGAQVMEQIARKALEESEYELETLAGRVEPAVVAVMSLLVGAILLSVMLPLMHIMTAIG